MKIRFAKNIDAISGGMEIDIKQVTLDTVRTFYTDKTLTSAQKRDLEPFGKYIDQLKGMDALLGDMWEYYMYGNS